MDASEIKRQIMSTDGNWPEVGDILLAILDRTSDPAKTVAAEEKAVLPSANIAAMNMTLRDYFAGQAMAGFCANPAVFAVTPGNGWSLVNCSNTQLAELCVALAGELLAKSGGVK